MRRHKTRIVDNPKFFDIPGGRLKRAKPASNR